MPEHYLCATKDNNNLKPQRENTKSDKKITSVEKCHRKFVFSFIWKLCENFRCFCCYCYCWFQWSKKAEWLKIIKMEWKKMFEYAKKLFNTFAALRFNLSPHELPKNIQTRGIYTYTHIYVYKYICILYTLADKRSNFFVALCKRSKHGKILGNDHRCELK